MIVIPVPADLSSAAPRVSFQKNDIGAILQERQSYQTQIKRRAASLFCCSKHFSSFADCINDNGEEDYSCSRRDIEIIGNEQPAQTAKVAYANGQPNDAVEPV